MINIDSIFRSDSQNWTWTLAGTTSAHNIQNVSKTLKILFFL
jgi:hypothetical protein